MTARDHQAEWRALRSDGATLKEIAEQFPGFSVTRIHQITGVRRPRPAKAKPKPPRAHSRWIDRSPREWWTYPDADLIRIAHEARDEIIENSSKRGFYS